MKGKPKEDEHGTITFQESRQDKIDGKAAVITIINSKKQQDMTAAPVNVKKETRSMAAPPSGQMNVRKEKRSMAAPPSGQMMVRKEKRSMAAPPSGPMMVKKEKRSMANGPSGASTTQPTEFSPVKDSPMRPSDLEIKSNGVDSN